jgi:hypothetical protein
VKDAIAEASVFASNRQFVKHKGKELRTNVKGS